MVLVIFYLWSSCIADIVDTVYHVSRGIVSSNIGSVPRYSELRSRMWSHSNIIYNTKPRADYHQVHNSPVPVSRPDQSTLLILSQTCYIIFPIRNDERSLPATPRPNARWNTICRLRPPEGHHIMVQMDRPVAHWHLHSILAQLQRILHRAGDRYLLTNLQTSSESFSLPLKFTS